MAAKGRRPSLPPTITPIFSCPLALTHTHTHMHPLSQPLQAPECMSDNLATLASDVYSFGVLMWELYCKEVPYSTIPPLQVGKRGGV